MQWDNSSYIVLEANGSDAVINVNGTGSFNLSGGVSLFKAQEGGGISLTGGGTIDITNSVIGVMSNFYAPGPVPGYLNLDGYTINVDNSAAYNRYGIIRLDSLQGNNSVSHLSNLNVTYKGTDGSGGGEFLEINGADALLTNNRIVVENSFGALNLGSSHAYLSDVMIDGGHYYGSKNYDSFLRTLSTGATIDVGGGSTLTISNNAYVGSDDGGQAMQIRSADVVTVNNSVISGGNAGILSSVVGGKVVLNSSLLEWRTGSALLVNPYDYLSSSVIPVVVFKANDSTLKGKYGLRVEQQGEITATLDNTVIDVTDVAIGVDRQGTALSPTAIINADLTNGSRILAASAFEAHDEAQLTVNLADSSVNATNTAIFVSGGSQVTLNAERSTISGNIVVTDIADRVDVVLNDSSQLSGSATKLTSLTLNDSVWNMTDNSSVTTLDNLSGNIIFAAPTNPMSIASYKTLTVNGNYTGGGMITMNTWLDRDGSETDKLIIEGDTSGQTALNIVNTGGAGNETIDGIQVVQVDGASNGTFTLFNRVIAGIYEYDVYQNAGDGGWYLQSFGSRLGGKDIAPEYGVHLANLSAASSMFMHTLHDRLGEPQFSDAAKNGDNLPGVWVQIKSAKSQYKTASDQIKTDIDTTVVRLGGDLARWSSNGDDRWHLGIMGWYGKSDVEASSIFRPTTNGGISRDASGSVEGYSAGAYATWYSNAEKPTGAYIDSWVQYGWFGHKVQGSGSVEDSYDSNGWTASLETGYAMILKDAQDYQFMIEPQFQIAYNNYKSDDYLDSNGTSITHSDAKGLVTRLGTRLYTRSSQSGNVIQPFIEANWWFNDTQSQQTFSGVKLKDGMPKNRYEVKAGIQSSIANHWQLWGHVGSQWGDNSYSSYAGSVGIKRSF